MWRRWLVGISNGIWLATVGLVILLAVYVALGRNLLPTVRYYKEDVRRFLAQQLNGQVSLESLSGTWDGLDPILIVRGLHLRGQDATPDQPDVIAVREFRIRLAMWRTLRQQKLTFGEVFASGIDVWLRQKDDGFWELPGFQAAADSGGRWNEFKSYLVQPRLDVAELAITLENQHGQRTTWQLPRAHMTYGGDRYQASGNLLQPDSNEDFLSFALTGTGNPFAGDFSGQVYLDGRTGQFLDPYLSAYNFNGVSAAQVDASVRGWLQFDNGQLQEAEGQIHVHELQWLSQWATQAPIRNLALEGLLQRQGEGWHAAVNHFDFAWQDQSWGGSQLNLSVQSNASQPDGKQLSVQIDRINLGMLASLALATQLVPAKSAQAIRGRQPEGELQNLDVQIPLGQDNAPLFQLKANLTKLQLLAYHHAPEISGVQGYLEFDNHQGFLDLASHPVSLGFPDLFMSAWETTEVSGRLSWRLLDDWTQVSGNGLQLRLPDQGLIQGSYDLWIGNSDVDDVTEDHLSLDLMVQNVSADQAKKFIPCHLIAAGICRWVDYALLAGQVRTGRYHYAGAVEKDAPPDHHESQLDLALAQVNLQYAEDWPLAENLEAELTLNGGLLNLQVAKGVVAASDVAGTRVWIPPHSAEQEPVLHVETNVSVDAASANFWLRQSPLAKNLSEDMNNWQLKGQFDTQLQLQVPLGDSGAPVAAQTDIAIQEGRLQIPAADLTLEGIHGKLRFDTRKGLSARNLRAQHLKQPLVIDLRSPTWGEGLKSVQVSVSGHTSLDQLYQWRQMAALPGLQGEADYRANILVQSRDAKTDITLDLYSDLIGIVSDWPEPLRKDADELMPLRYVQKLGQANSRAQLALGDQVDADLQFSQGQYTGGVVQLKEPQLPEDVKSSAAPSALQVVDRPMLTETLTDQTTHIQGRIRRLNVDAWRDFLEHEFESDSDQEPPKLSVDLTAAQFQLFDRNFRDVHFQLDRADQAWRAQFLAKDQLDGRVVIADESALPIQVHFKRLHIPPVAGGAGQTHLSPQDIPLLDLDIADLQLGERDYGAWSFVTERRQDGVIFKNLSGRMRGGEVKGRLSWLKDPQTQQDTSILTATLKGDKIEDFVENWGKESSITSEKMEFDLGLTWAAAPMDFEMAKTSGQVSFKMEHGAFRETTRTADALRIFGILNMESVTRRLRLDFSDLYEKGVSYDLMDGKASLHYGVMKFDQPLAIKGPSSAYKISGQADLGKDLLDLEMVVILPVTKNLPLAAILVGAPQVGGALFLIDRLLGDPLSRLTSVTYTIKGDLNNPDVEIKNVFDTKGTSNVRQGGGR